MKLKILAFLLILLGDQLELKSQIGLLLTGKNHLFNPGNGSSPLQVQSLTQIDAGASYGIGLKRIRLELHPGLTIGYGTGDFHVSEHTFRQIAASLSIPVIFYPLDFSNDCNCPTFNKQGEFFEKGLYFILRPGVSHVWRNVEEVEGAEEFKGILPEIGLGLGFDFGLSRQTTLSVFLLMARTFNGNFEFAADQKVWQKSAAHMNLELGFRYLWYSKRRR